MSVHLPLLWREFFFVVASKHTNFDKMRNNSLCLQFPWEEHQDQLERFKQVTSFLVYKYITSIIVDRRWHSADITVCWSNNGAVWVLVLAGSAVLFSCSKGAMSRHFKSFL